MQILCDSNIFIPLHNFISLVLAIESKIHARQNDSTNKLHTAKAPSIFLESRAGKVAKQVKILAPQAWLPD